MTPVTYPPGSVIGGKYRIERALGEGGMGVVVEATHLALGQRVAMKLLRGDAARSPEALTRFLREGQIAAQLPAEHVARVTDVGQTEEGEPFLVMELLDGCDLASELANRGAWFPVDEAVDLVLQACEGVAEAHALGLVHRDIKPANLFIVRRRSGAPLVKVLDFGLSKVPRSGDAALTQTASNFGTPLYMSPEQIQSAKHVDARTDQHALAMVLFELLTRRPPYDGESPTAIAVAIATQPPPRARALRADVPAGLDAAIATALGKTPAERFPDLAAFAAAIAPFGGPVAAASAAAVRRALVGDEEPAPPAAHAMSSSPSEMARTTPLHDTGKSFTSSLDTGERLARSRRRVQGIVIGATAALGVGLAIALWSSAPGEPAASRANAGVAQAAAPALRLLPPAPAVTLVEPQPSASPSVRATSGRGPRTPPSARTPTSPTTSSKNERPPEHVFDARNKKH